MFKPLFIKFATVLLGLAGLLGFYSRTPVTVSAPAPQPVLGATIPVVISLFETSLQSNIGSGDTSMTLVSGTDRAGNSLSGYMCFTIDEGTSSVEYVCGTASSTSVTAMTRGIDPLTGTSTVASLQKVHRRGADVKITDYPQLAIISRILNGNETLPNPIKYDGSISTSTLASNSGNLVNVGLLNSTALQGAPIGTTTTAGVVKFASPTQLSSGAIGDGTYYYVPSVANFTYNPVSATSVPVSNSSGKIAQGWLDLTQPFAFTATTTLAATSTAPLILRGVNYTFPATNATGTLANNGSGILSWQTAASFASSTSITSGNSTTTKSVTFTTGFQPSVITAYYQLQGSDSSNTIKITVGTAVFASTTLVANYTTESNGSTSTAIIGTGSPSSGSTGIVVTLSISSVSSTGFTALFTINDPTGATSQSSTVAFVATQ